MVYTNKLYKFSVEFKFYIYFRDIDILSDTYNSNIDKKQVNLFNLIVQSFTRNLEILIQGIATKRTYI